MTGNPLVAGPVSMSTPLSGTFLLEDCESIASGIRNGDWVEGGMGAFAAVADGLAMVVDPLGSLIAAGLGWLMEHMEPLKGWFNDLTGDAGEVMGFAATWENIANEMKSVAAEVTRILGDLDDQSGAFIETYRKFQSEASAHVAAAGVLAGAMGVGMQMASTIVQIVHDITRDALSQIVGTAISATATAVFTLGFGTPWAVSQVATRAASLSARVSSFVTKLLRTVKALLPKLDDAARLFRSLQDGLDRAIRSATDGASSASRHLDDIGPGSPSIRHMDDVPPGRTYDEAVSDRIADGTWEDPGSRPSWASTAERGETFFGPDALRYYEGDGVTLGAPGRPAFLMPGEDGARILTHEQAMIQTGRAPSVEEAYENGRQIFGVNVPLEGQDLRVPTFNDANLDPSKLDPADINPNFVPGGNTALNDDGVFRSNQTREAVVDGGRTIPPGSYVFELLPDGQRRLVRQF
ncbi:hypothetical protein [Demequina aurantiaca]|uniref:hypothetical protein n=1 Tax=Demequina aurantiaca TaxID=676200 RepID=UPI00078677AD|nr:hypothetical protein [Demequina aurantiaca]